MSTTAQTTPAAHRTTRSFRAGLMRQIVLWHWVSSGVCLCGLLLFTITGVTLNHAAQISATALVEKREARVPAAIQPLLAQPQAGRQALAEPLRRWLENAFGVRVGDSRLAEWSEQEVYVSLPGPGVDAWIAIDRPSGQARFEKTDRGWIAYFNDLHKGRHTGPAWSVFIDVLAAGCLVFAATGLVLLYNHAAKRPATWPLVVFGSAVPILLLILFVHR